MLTFTAGTTAVRGQESKRRWRDGFPGAALFHCKAETNLGWGSHFRSVTWPSEVLKEVRRPCSVDKVHMLCWAEDSVYLPEESMKRTYFFCTVSLPSCKECDPPPSFKQHTITLYICYCLGFAFVILTQTQQICGVNYYFNWDTLLGSPSRN